MKNYDTKQTLKNLHKAFPELSVDDLLKILDCFAPECPSYSYRYPFDGNIALYKDESRTKQPTFTGTANFCDRSREC